MIKALIFCDSTCPSQSVDIIKAVELIAGNNKSETYLAQFHGQADTTQQCFDYLIEIDPTGISSWDVVNMVNALEELYRKYCFNCLLFPATFWGRMLAPRLAMRLGVGLTAGVTDIGETAGEPALIRPAFDGKLFASIVTNKKQPLMASIGSGVFTYTGDKKSVTQKIRFTPTTVEPCAVELLETTKIPESGDICESDVLVSGGGGTIEYFDKLNSLAKALGGMVSASRRIVDSRIAPRSIQVGHSGKSVSPSLYIALGIYGSLQHVEGLKDAETILSVNVNKNAPICSLSDVVVEGDAEKFIELLVERIERDFAEVDADADTDQDQD